MNSIVIYGSRFGNTQRVAEAIAGVLRERGDVRLLPAEEASAVVPHAGDLLVVGGPTEGHTWTPAVREYLEALRPHGLRGVKAAAFDTRVGWPQWLSGSASYPIARKLTRLGARIITPEGSFLVSRQNPALLPGELERARAWAVALAEAAEPATAGSTSR
jgi:flavorubredoxin